jgi:LPXTG-motif cell wall-anchored protein
MTVHANIPINMSDLQKFNFGIRDAATQFKPGVDKFDVRSLDVNLQVLSQGLPTNPVFPVFPAVTLALSSSVMNLGVGQEENGLILLGVVFLLLGLFWLKKARRNEGAQARPSAENQPSLWRGGLNLK